jgi:hypothetical protein
MYPTVTSSPQILLPYKCEGLFLPTLQFSCICCICTSCDYFAIQSEELDTSRHVLVNTGKSILVRSLSGSYTFHRKVIDVTSSQSPLSKHVTWLNLIWMEWEAILLRDIMDNWEHNNPWCELGLSPCYGEGLLAMCLACSANTLWCHLHQSLAPQ